MRRLPRPTLLWPLAILVIVVIAVVAALAVTPPSGGGAPLQVVLDGIPERDFSDHGVRLIQPNRAPTIDSAAAEIAAKSGVPGTPSVKETVLARVVNDRADPPVDTLAWAVSLDPASVHAFPVLGPGQYNQCVQPLYSVVFIDALTGDFLFGTERRALDESESKSDCPQLDTPDAPTPRPES